MNLPTQVAGEDGGKPLLRYHAEFDSVLPSLNRVLRMHWAARKRLSQQWAWRVLAARPAVWNTYKRARVEITRVSPRSLDQDNLYGAAKILVDALKTAMIITDDDPSHLELVCVQKVGKPVKTLVTAIPINEVIA